MRTGIAFGSNLGDRMDFLRRGREAVLSLPSVSGPHCFSSVYETEPVETEPGATAFLNAVAEVEFEGHPLLLLDALQEIEARFGRPSKRPRNAPRPIDLDVLYVGNLVLRNEEIVIPHPRLHMRRFVLQPLAEIRPELVLPGQEQSVAELLEALRDTSAVERYTEEWTA
jgi:2-amino-4-hydroxy-6-hydroxymethyldihydropteridine diphosphokinase